MIRLVLIAAFASAACLDSPPSSTGGGDTPDAGPCGDLDLFVETFDETNPDVRFRELWDPGIAPYYFSDGTLFITGMATESDIYSHLEYERSGALRYEKLGIEDGGTAAVSIWNDPDGAAGILLDDTSTLVYAPNDRHLEMPRDFDDVFFMIAFEGGDIVYRASHDGSSWRTLQTWPDEFTQLVRLGLAAFAPSLTADMSLGGINTSVVDCQ